MIRRIPIILVLALFITSCAGAPAATNPPAVQPFSAQPSNNVPPETTTPEPTIEPIAAATSTPLPTATPILPTPTETLLPPLELPTEALNAPAKMVWDGTPTYLGDSKPGYSFRVSYDPDIWASTTDQFGFPALAHRAIPYCVIAPAAGRGLPANLTVEHDILYMENITFDVNTAYENGLKKFVTFVGGDGMVFTGFEVDFQDQADQCLADAVTVLSTLKSVPVSQATPQP